MRHGCQLYPLSGRGGVAATLIVPILDRAAGGLAILAHLMFSPSAIRAVEPIVVALPRDTPYLGPLGPGEEVNDRGYFVRRGNRTIYPTVDRSVLVKITSADGFVGWGETYGIIAPEAVVALLRDVMIPIVLQRTTDNPAAIYAELYDLMREIGGTRLNSSHQ